MTASNLFDLATVRKWGTVLLGKNVRCDGDGSIDTFERRVACYTHIHQDHLDGFESAFSQCDAVITHEINKELLIALRGPTWLPKKNNFVGLKYGKAYEYKDETITLYDSNHILGSSQVLVESSGKRILYSSDFNMPGAKKVKDVDILLIDSTHGEPIYNDNEPKKNKLKDIKKLVTEETKELRAVIIRAARGKLQYLMHILRTEVQSSIPFIVKEDDRRLSDVYANHGMSSGQLIRDESSEFDTILKKNEPYVRFYPTGGMLLPCELQGTRSIRVGNPPEYSIEATNMFQINLTDHASFDGVMDYVSSINPKLVITDNSGRTRGLTSIALATEIKHKLNIDAAPIPKPKPVT